MHEWPLKIYQQFMGWLVPLGGWALALIALMDSSFLSLPEVNDILIITLTIQNPDSMFFYCAMTTLGSVAGCFLLFSVGRIGGEILLRKKLAEKQIQRISNWYSRYGIITVVVPSLLPPPTPFKVFVLFAGAMGISRGRFLLAVTLGRSLRYFLEGMLALRYGKQAVSFIRDYYPEVAWFLLGAFLAVFCLRLLWHKTMKRNKTRQGISS